MLRGGMMVCSVRFLLILVVLPCYLLQQYDDLSYQPDFLDMDPDSILEENAIITANATCGTNRREYFCRLVEHDDGALLYRRDPRQVETYTKEEKSYRNPSGKWVQCSFCDANDPRLNHPIEYVLRGESDLWWQSPSLAEGLHYHAVTITMDFNQVYQIVYVLLRMGDSPRPANWILERSLDGVNYKPWVFFAESEYDCKRLYEPLIEGPLTVTSGPRPWKLEDDEVYCTTFYSQPQALQSGEIIVTLTLDRVSTISGNSGIERAISPKLIDFLSARYIRLRFQKLQTLSGDWMAMPNQLDSSVYNRYYYSIRTIKVGGKCLCNSHANRCEQAVVDGVPRAVCLCQHNTCGSNCEVCCPLFNQQPWRPGRVCEECNCNGKADSCVYNQTVANMRLSMRKDGVYEGGGVCVDCREDTSGINCEKCKPGYYRPINVRPEASFPCVKCECDSYGSTGECVTNDAEVPERYPGDCICKEGFAGKRCDQCAEGYRRSTSDARRCVPCTCDVRGSHRGGSYQCEPPCNCKVNVNPESNCRQCQPGHFNLDAKNPEGCQACYCSGLTNQCNGVSPITALALERNGQLGTVSTLTDWRIIIPSAPADSGYVVPITHGPNDHEVPISAEIRTVESWLSSVTLRPVDRGYYWSAPNEYLGNQITAYRSSLMIILRLHSPTLLSFFGTGSVGLARRDSSAASLAIRDRLHYLWLYEPDIVLEGNGYRLAHILPSTYRDNHMIIQLPLHESSFRVLIEPPSSAPLDKIPIGLAQGSQLRKSGYDDTGDEYELIGRPATVADLITVLSSLERLLIKAKYINDQTMVELNSVKLERAKLDPTGGIPSLEECICPPGHMGTSCESCAPGYWLNLTAFTNQTSMTDQSSLYRGMWRSARVQIKCVPCECHGHSSQCDQKTGKCIDCQHHTSGDKCDHCAPGYYGDPLSGSPTACQPCECPTLSNEKTKSCVALEQELNQGALVTKNDKPYVCLDCKDNTRGRYCEVCAEGYYGQPVLGVACKKCDCGRGAIGCNSTTGVCICGFNTAGPRCDSCAEGTHGDPLLGQACRPCNCHEKGSISPTCRAGDGQCSCHPSYEGVRCERCVDGRGNVDAGCPPCQCHPIGTKPGGYPACDPVSGQCPCKPGVGGSLDCSQCMPGYFNLGPNGCEECQCSNRAIDRVCDPTTGRCKCGENVVGDGCDQCLSGHYWNVTGPNCIPCECGIGTKQSSTVGKINLCNMETGQCECAQHVTGRQCTECEPGYFGVSSEGCQPCPMCPNGQVCDQVTGKCICPPHTQGDRCEECAPGSYDYNPIKGCKQCNCSEVGSALATSDTCDLVTGQCICEPGYAGRACDQCEAGHYGYPNCRPCDCDPQGTQRQNDTSQAIVACNRTDGSCICKSNVEGPRCDQCKPGTFGLNMDYALGCYTCFCFPTSASPKCSPLTGYRSVPGKQKGVDIIASDLESVPGGALIQLAIGLGPEASTDLSIGVNQFEWRFSTHRPTFMEIPELKGSLMRNYGSVIIAVSTECLRTGDCRLNAPDSRYPVELMTIGSTVGRDEAGGFIVRLPYRIDAKLTALNGSLEMEYQPADETTRVDGFRHIWLRESDWVLTRVLGHDTRVRPTRNELMLALLNVTSFSVRLFMPEANPKMVSVRYRIYEALTETATVSGTPIRSIEKCDCPNTASGDHCEIASPGFYFPQLIPKPGPNVIPTPPGIEPPRGAENVIWMGGVEKCRCHGMSSHCDPVTGVCEACTGNTVGPDCGECAMGYMGDPKQGQPCVKCQCPTDQTDYAITCIPMPDRPYLSHQCVCKPGYSGDRCEVCAPGYFGDPTSMIACQPCDCDMAGALSPNCAQDTGQCRCAPGVHGRRCDQCEPDHVVDARRCIDCRGPCTGELFTKADEVMNEIDNLNVTSLAHRGLARLGHQVEEARKRFSPARQKAEEELLIRTQQIAKQTVQLREQVDRAQITSDAIQTTRCITIGNGTELRNDITGFRRRVSDWVQQVREAPTGRPDQGTIQRWREEAQRVLTELQSINLNSTEKWINELLESTMRAVSRANSLLVSVKPGKSETDLERFKTYQEEQEMLLDFYRGQLYLIGNETQSTVRELNAAKKKSEKLEKASQEAIDPAVLRAFEAAMKSVNDQLDEWGTPETQEQLKRKIDEAKAALKELNGVVLVQLTDVRIPGTLKVQVVEPMEREADGILRTLEPSSRLNRTMEAVDMYQTIVNNMEAAHDATNKAEEALKQSTTGQDQSWQNMIAEVVEKGAHIQTTLDNVQAILTQRNETFNEAVKRLNKVSTDLILIGQTAEQSLSHSKETVEKVKTVTEVLEMTEPLAKNASSKSGTQRIKLDDLTDRLQQMENRYAQLQGTAQSMVDQTNTTQSNMVKLITDAEGSMKQLDAKLLQLRRLADEARSMLDVTYGALAQDPVPMELGRSCVYSLVPYALTKSRVFDVEFWFKLHDLQTAMNSVIMVGRRAFAGRTQMFAFTLEAPEPTLRFSWNVMGGNLEIGPIREGIWYQVRVSSILGETRMMLTERPEEDEIPGESKTREVVSSAGADHPESALMLDRQMELRIGGVIQTGTRMVNAESWGDNAAEAFWSRLLSMSSPEVCVFNLRLGGMRMSLVDLATATSSCTRPKRLRCQIRLNYRPLIRDGYIWRPQGQLKQLTTRMRPARDTEPQYVLQRLFYYDFAGANGYARLKSSNDLQFCKDLMQFQLTPLDDAQNERMMGFTFFDYKKDFGVTVELVNGRPKATRWIGNELYQSMHSSELLETGDTMRRRALRAVTLSDSIYLSARLRRNVFGGSGKEKVAESISLNFPQQGVWRLDSVLTGECHEDVSLFVGGIPPGHYSLRRRMAELGLTLNPFRGRIGLGKDSLGQDGDLYLDDYVMAPVNHFGDSHFTDLRQRGESLVVENTRPDSQYCLRLTSHDMYTPLELIHTKVGSPFNPGVSMTIRFNPLNPIAEDINLLRVQVSSAEWFRVWLTSDHRVGILIPGGRKELITKEPLSYRPLEDSSYVLRDLELAEAKMINASLPAWKEVNEELGEEWKQPEVANLPGEIEVAVTLHFGGTDSRQLYVLYDQRLVQSWTIPRSLTDAQVQQILIGPHTKISQPLTINYLVIGKTLVDFSTQLSNSMNRNGSHIGFCGGQLHPRFFERQGPIGPVWIEQGLDLAPPPGGRRLRFVDSTSSETNISLSGVNQPSSMKPMGRLRREEDCTSNPENTAWFDQSATSYWELSDLGARIRDSDKPFEFKIGFRAQLSRGTSGSVLNSSPLPGIQYTLLAAFNFGPDVDNLYLILSESQIFLTDNRRVLWSSPHLTIAETNWHQLILTFPEEINGNGELGSNEYSGPIVESGIHMMFDGRDLWLPPLESSPKPILALIGGLPAGQKLSLDPDTNVAPVTGLFGCVDELEVNGIQFDPKQSGRPACYDCFSLDPNIVHIPRSIEKYLDSTLIPLEVPSEFLEPDVPHITFDFSIFYDREVLPSSSLFVFAFEGEQNDELVTHRIWLHLAETEVKMSPAPYDEPLADYGHAAPLLSLPRYTNTWQFIKLQMFFDYGNVVLQLQSQGGDSLPMAMFNNANRLKSIHFARDSVVTPEEQNTIVLSSTSHTFTGCIRDMRLTSSTLVRTVRFPSNVPELLKGVCHTSMVW